MNKKGLSFSSWMEVIILCVAIVIAFGVIFNDSENGLNAIHGGNFSLGLGTSGTVTALESLQNQMQTKTQTGEISFLGYLGMTLNTAWDMVLGITSVTWNFITGGWIENILTDYLNVPAQITILIRILFFLSIGFVIFKLLFRVNT